MCTVQLRDFDEEKRRRAAGRFDQSGRRRPGDADQGPTSERSGRQWALTAYRLRVILGVSQTLSGNGEG